MSVGIDFNSMLASLWNQLPRFGVIVLLKICWIRILIDCDQKWLPTKSVGSLLLRYFFDPVLQVVFLKVPWFPCGSLSAPFWFPVGSILIVWGILFDPF